MDEENDHCSYGMNSNKTHSYHVIIKVMLEAYGLAQREYLIFIEIQNHKRQLILGGKKGIL